MDAELMMRAVGPAADGGKLPLSELARLAGELQATLERLALALRGTSTSVGRRPGEIVNSVRLDLVGLTAGSAVLHIEPAGAGSLDRQLLDDSLALLMLGAQKIAERQSDTPAEFTPQVLDGLIRLSGGLSAGSIERLELDWHDHSSVVLDKGFRDHARWLRQQSRHDLRSIVGRLHEADFDPLALRCRVDTLEASILCSFTDELREQVLAAMDSMVIATGIAELQPDGAVRTLAIDDLTIIDEAQRRTVAQLADEQGIQPVSDATEFATLTDIDDGDFDRFVNDAMSARQ